jgi:glucan phosphorylase
MQHETTSRDTWFSQHYGELDGRPVAYFCAEFGLHSSVPIYSGTLGMLATDSTLYREATATVIQFRELLTDIQAQPRKYLKISVF